MKLPLLTLLIFSLAVAQDDSELELLPPDAFKNEVLRRELALQGIETAKDSVSRTLLQASVFYYDKKWDSAYFAYMPVLDKVSDLLYGPLVIRIARCQLERGYPQESKKLLLSVKSIKNNKSSWEEADQILLEGVLRDSTTTQKAKKDSIEKRLKLKPSTNYGQILKLELATLKENENDAKGAIDSYFSVLRGGGQYADLAFKALQRLTPNSTDYDFVRYICRKGSTEKCVEKISIVLKDSKLDSTRKVNFMVQQAEAWKRLSKNDSAIWMYKKLLDSVDYNTSWLQSLIRMVRSAGNRAEAKKLDSIFQKKFPFSSENANNLWVRGLEHEQANEYKKAIETYKQLYDSKFGKHQRRQWAKFRVGFINFKEKKYAEAANIFAEAASERQGLMPRSAALYFYAECQRLLEQKDKAAKAYFDVIADFPLGYYSWRAKQNLTKFELAENIPEIGAEMQEDAAIAWLKALQKKEANEKDSLVSVERLEQISVLLRSGFEKEAFALYENALKFHKNRPEFYYRYGMMFMQNGEHALAHKLARNLLDIVPREKISGAPKQVLRFLFPMPHEAKVKNHAKIDPLLVYSVMRQESIFDAKIQSPAGARGLMQIMPATGEFLAKSEGVEGYDKDLLYNAYLNIRLGVRYLNDLSAEYNNDYIGILGNYNAGPAAAKRWLASYGSLPWDIRVEDVSYWETRDYVKRVMGNYWTYKEIYGSD
ncbi:MAG: transglycosylase SLT domain-containing protein [Fibromonadales bacterium]|nr:transglycosylase SLT domain-containing protein [Fibromonadales bacterium]